MFRHILVPLDFTRKNAPAVRVAAELAAPGDAKVTLLHVIEKIAGIPFDEMRDFYRRAESRSEEQMERFAARLRKARVRADEKVLLGNRVDEILKYALRNRVDLIVLSSHKVDLRRPGQGFGTISYKVGILARCPVLLVK